MRTKSLGSSTGKIIYGDDTFPDIFQLPIPKIRNLFKVSGVLLFRGFAVNCQKMKMFSEQFSVRHFRNHTKAKVENEEFIDFVDAGRDHLVTPHSEYAYSPFRPDVVWFCCGVPADQGGETLFWDGARVWEELNPDVKQLFLSKKLKFSHNNIPVDFFKSFVEANATVVDIQEMLSKLDGVTFQINKDKTVSLEYVCSAISKTKYGHKDAFANSFLPYQIKTKQAIFEDGSRAPDKVVTEIQRVLDRLTEEISWEAGDLAMIDNSRFLHGRRVFHDDRRQIFTTLSNLNF